MGHGGGKEGGEVVVPYTKCGTCNGTGKIYIVPKPRDEKYARLYYQKMKANKMEREKEAREAEMARLKPFLDFVKSLSDEQRQKLSTFLCCATHSLGQELADLNSILKNVKS